MIDYTKRILRFIFYKECEYCKGSGEVEVYYGQTHSAFEECYNCKGKGYLNRFKNEQSY